MKCLLNPTFFFYLFIFLLIVIIIINYYNYNSFLCLFCVPLHSNHLLNVITYMFIQTIYVLFIFTFYPLFVKLYFFLHFFVRFVCKSYSSSCVNNNFNTFSLRCIIHCILYSLPTLTLTGTIVVVYGHLVAPSNVTEVIPSLSVTISSSLIVSLSE